MCLPYQLIFAMVFFTGKCILLVITYLTVYVRLSEYIAWVQFGIQSAQAAVYIRDALII